ncbi:exodeoxyribonuclease VII large subunit [Breznakiella homolactica]|uniref:Exodeoxyribonuclease 7 large subunit n=1 Tax=Breznakiella homolactica TaxID=2798577 RepID=A0A7T7XLI7_9SPIR|nr:exodeoxyribonuclease VII large subunit [Breznakiella homolactica]QQO08413.1 exodeoxyribonuclease VII large subunit [Breznakiella homolactica]
MEQQKLTVSELTELIRLSLEGNFSSLSVEGELSNCRPSSTGHLYFTLKDSGAAISGVMFKNRLRYLGFEPKDGMLLRVKGSLSVYAQRGTYQIVCEEMEQAGTGELLVMLEKRKQMLAAEGLFDEDRKRPIPRYPGTVGVVSSPTGAAVRDILNVLGRRAAGLRIVVLPAPVQGNDAAPIITRRIEQANEWKLADVLIVGRGGGSLEDLLPFSEESVVRAVAASEIPVISAVGHEIDWTLSDFAADLRAPTPSAAAELVSESRRETLDQVRALGETLYETLEARLDRARLLLKPFSAEDLEYRFRSILQPRLVRFDDAKEDLLRALSERIGEIRRRLELARTSLEAGSPLSVLERGFSVVINETNGKLLRSGGDAKPGDRLKIRPLEGIVYAQTEASGPEENS